MADSNETAFLEGRKMHSWICDLMPMRRSLSGPGVRETLTYLKALLPDLQIHEVASGVQAFDWVVPDEWTLRDAYVADESGTRVIDLSRHGLHIMGYSEPVDSWMDLDELQKHLYSLPEQPDAIPYVTSYYKKRWGFCLTQRQRDGLRPGRYHAVVDADLQPGVLNYADLVLPGRETNEILLSTYICHPEMANNELSGPALATALAHWLSTRDRRFTYRLVFAPETIGSIIYLSQHMNHLKRRTQAGFVLTCVGDERTYSFMPSRKGETLADRAALHVLRNYANKHRVHSFLERGSDERQYCSPLVDLPVVSIMRSKYGTYPEYHTSLDNLSLVTPAGLQGGFDMMRRCLEVLEGNHRYRATVPCEPQLGKRGLYPTLSTVGSADKVRSLTNLLAYADGEMDLIELAERTNTDALSCIETALTLCEHGLLEIVS
ncbi:DUF4910 domain-containing protein [Pelagibius litoralis]|nr:DUF4910 domain-containing protein [Pelagibius litoralis]